MAEGKFRRVDKHLRIAVEVEVPNESITRLDRTVTIPGLPGVVEVRPHPTRDAIEVYLETGDHDKGADYPKEIRVQVPGFLDRAPWGAVVMGNSKPGAQVLFGRLSEERVFAPDKPGDYISLRLYREREYSFEPVYVRVTKGPEKETYFFVVRARWEGGTITVEIQHDPTDVPHFLT